MQNQKLIKGVLPAIFSVYDKDRNVIKETVESTSFDVVDGKYVENTKLNRKYISDCHNHQMPNLLFQ